MTQASTVLWQAFLGGPSALAGLEDGVVTDRIALEDLNTAVSAFEGNVAIEGFEYIELQDLRLAAVELRGKLTSGDHLNPKTIRATLSALQQGVLHLPADQREKALARVRRPIFATSFTDLRPAILATLGARDVVLTDEEANALDRQLHSDAELAVAEAGFRVLERKMWNQFPGEHVIVRASGEVIAHDRDEEAAIRKLMDYQKEHGPTATWCIAPEGTPKPHPGYLREAR